MRPTNILALSAPTTDRPEKALPKHNMSYLPFNGHEKKGYVHVDQACTKTQGTAPTEANNPDNRDSAILRETRPEAAARGEARARGLHWPA